MGLWLLGEAMDMGVGFDCFLLLLDLLPNNAAIEGQISSNDLLALPQVKTGGVAFCQPTCMGL